MFMTIFAVITSILMLIGVNADNLICNPWEDPFSRPDMLSVSYFKRFQMFVEYLKE